MQPISRPYILPAQVYQTCPQALLPVLPQLKLELPSESIEQRLAAVDLLGKLFSIPGSDLDITYHELVILLVHRMKDLQVRLH